MSFADSRLSQYRKAGLAFNTLVNHNVSNSWLLVGSQMKTFQYDLTVSIVISKIEHVDMFKVCVSCLAYQLAIHVSLAPC